MSFCATIKKTFSIQRLALKALHFEGNMSENYRGLEEQWRHFEKTELERKSEENASSFFSE